MDKVSDDPKGRLKIQSSQRKTGFPSKESGLFYSKLRNLFSLQRGRSVPAAVRCISAWRFADVRCGWQDCAHPSTNRSDVTLPCLNVLRYRNHSKTNSAVIELQQPCFSDAPSLPYNAVFCFRFPNDHHDRIHPPPCRLTQTRHCRPARFQKHQQPHPAACRLVRQHLRNPFPAQIRRYRPYVGSTR